VRKFAVRKIGALLANAPAGTTAPPNGGDSRRRLLKKGRTVLAILALGLFLIIPIWPGVFRPLDNAPLLKGILHGVLCGPNEELTASYSTDYTSGKFITNVELSCVDSRQNALKVTDKLYLICLAFPLGLFFVSFLMTILARRTPKSI